MKGREAFLDKLRVAATCAVVLLHTVTGVMDHADMGQFPLERKVFLAVMDLVCWCVPVFLMISGYLFLNPDRKLTIRDMLAKYCRRIVLALLLFGVPYACLEQIAGAGAFRWDMVWRAFGMVLRGESWSHMWYLYLILILYLLTPLIRLLVKMVPRRYLIGILSILAIGSSVLPYLSRLGGLGQIPMLSDVWIYLFYYICGALFRGDFRKPFWKKMLPAAAALLAAGMACSRLLGNHTLQMAYNYPFTVALALLLFAWGKSAQDAAGREEKEGTFWRRASDLSFAIYLVHPLFLNAAYKYFRITPLSYPIGFSLPAFFFLTLLFSAALAWALRLLAPLRESVL